jgi:hypothetical protein
VKSNDIILNLAIVLESRWPDLPAEVDRILNGEGLVFDNEDENAAAGFVVLRKCAESKNDRIEIQVGNAYGRGKSDEALETFKDLFVETFYEYLDEHLDDSRNLLNLLLRFKRSCEWFNRDRLLNNYIGNTGSGENTLANHLYEYLYDQGIDFHVEPKTDTGRIDLISDQVGTERLLVDAKIYDPEGSKNKTYIVKGYNQMLTYQQEYNETVGYLVIFQASGNDLSILLKEKDNKIPFIQHKNKVTFFVVVDLRNLPSASKRGQHETTVITEDDLVSIVGGA